MTQRVLTIALSALTFVVLGACATASVGVPEGFARYSDRGDFIVVSPESITLRVKTSENKPMQSLDFWAEALRVHLEQSGYAFLGSASFDSQIGQGVFYEWAAPVGEEDWVYMTAISVVKGTIVIVEAAGPYEQYRSHRAAIRESLSTLNTIR